MKKSFGPKTLIYPNPVLVVGSYDTEGKENAMTAAWGGIACSDPPCVTVSVRKARHTYAGMVEHQAFTINIPSVKYVAEADYFGMKSGKNEDKFAVTALTAIKGQYVDAPYIREFPVVLECKLLQMHDLGTHTLFVGEILDVKVDEEVLDDSGNPDIAKIQPFLYDVISRHYYGVGRIVGRAFTVGKGFF